MTIIRKTILIGVFALMSPLGYSQTTTCACTKDNCTCADCKNNTKEKERESCQRNLGHCSYVTGTECLCKDLCICGNSVDIKISKKSGYCTCKRCQKELYTFANFSFPHTKGIIVGNKGIFCKTSLEYETDYQHFFPKINVDNYYNIDICDFNGMGSYRTVLKHVKTKKDYVDIYTETDLSHKIDFQNGLDLYVVFKGRFYFTPREQHKSTGEYFVKWKKKKKQRKV